MAILTQTNNLSIIPGGVPLVVHVSQGDRSMLVFNLVANGEAFVPAANAVATVEGVRMDGVGVGPAEVALSGSTAAFKLSAAMTAVAGIAPMSITISDSTGEVNTANFMLAVEVATFPDGPVYETDPGVYQRILNYVQSLGASLKSMVGTPLLAATKAAMTDQSKIYVYTGSESGMTAGNWYYFDTATNAWASGGIYNSAAVATDKTLTESDKAADAAVVGTRLFDGKDRTLNFAAGLTYFRITAAGYGTNNPMPMSALPINSFTTAVAALFSGLPEGTAGTGTYWLARIAIPGTTGESSEYILISATTKRVYKGYTADSGATVAWTRLDPEVDATLTVSGQGADAAATGTALYAAKDRAAHTAAALTFMSMTGYSTTLPLTPAALAPNAYTYASGGLLSGFGGNLKTGRAYWVACLASLSAANVRYYIRAMQGGAEVYIGTSSDGGATVAWYPMHYPDAPEYDEAETYEQGDYCTHFGVLYRCKSRTTGTWAGSGKWDQVYIADELEAVRQTAASASAAATDVQGRMASVEGRVASVESGLDTVGDKADDTADALAALAPRVTAAEGDIDALEGRAATAEDDITALQTEMDTKANVDGYYEELTAGGAETLVTDVKVTEQVPYVFRHAGGGASVGTREYDTIVGGSIVSNQLVQNGDFSSGISNWDGLSADISASDGVLTIAATGEGAILRQNLSQTIPAGHKVICSFDSSSSISTTATRIRLYNTTDGANAGVVTAALEADKWTHIVGIVSTSRDANRVYVSQDRTVAVGDTLQIKNVQVIDLTQMFGAAVADAIYALEQSTAGAGVQVFKRWFPQNYIPYSTGAFKHVTGLTSHNMVGFNQWDEEWEQGNIDSTTGENSGGDNRIRSKNYIRVIPGATYYFKRVAAFSLRLYDSEKAYISGENLTTSNLWTCPDGVSYIRFSYGSTSSPRTSYDPTTDPICINFSWSGTRNGEYEAYKKHSYPLDSTVVLRGIPKVDASGNVYYDGDRYHADGTIERRYGIVDLGTLTWGYTTSGQGRMDATLVGVKPSANSDISNIKCPVYDTSSPNAVYSGTKGIAIHSTGKVWVYDPAYGSEDVAAFKAAVSGVYLVYELAEPQTETATPFAASQVVDDWGTEEYAGAEIPVGHITDYPADLVGKLEKLPDSADADGTYIIQQESGKQLLRAYPFPALPTEDGTYLLGATVSGGTASMAWVAQQ